MGWEFLCNQRPVLAFEMVTSKTFMYCLQTDFNRSAMSFQLNCVKILFRVRSQAIPALMNIMLLCQCGNARISFSALCEIELEL